MQVHRWLVVRGQRVLDDSYCGYRNEKRPWGSPRSAKEIVAVNRGYSESGLFWSVDVLDRRSFAKFAECTSFDLPDAFFGDA